MNDKPVETEIFRLQDLALEKIRAVAKAAFDQARVNIGKNFDEFLEGAPGQHMRHYAFSTAVVSYLEAERQRRSEWEAKIEARLNGCPVT